MLLSFQDINSYNWNTMKDKQNICLISYTEKYFKNYLNTAQ